MPRTVQQAVEDIINQCLSSEATREVPENAGNPVLNQPIEAQVYRAECIQSVIHTQF